MDQPRVKICIAVIISLGAILAFVFGAMPLQMIVFAQGITILIVPVKVLQKRVRRRFQVVVLQTFNYAAMFVISL